MEIEPIHLDNHLIVVSKSAGVPVQSDATHDRTLMEMVRGYLKREFRKPGNVYLGLVHRLDRPVSGVIVLARTSKAAARLSEQFRNRTPLKVYWALVRGKTKPTGHLVDYILRNGPTSSIADERRGKRAELRYRRLDFRDGVSFVEISMRTGRHHQIRVQFSHRNHAVLGDLRYGSEIRFPRRAVALHARSITIRHPVGGKPITFTAEPEEHWPREFLKGDG